MNMIGAGFRTEPTKDQTMLTKMTLAAAIVAAAAFLTPVGAAPAVSPANPAAQTSAEGGLVTQVRHRRVHRHRAHHRRVHRRRHIRHRGWRQRCAARYGFRTAAYYRCLRRHR